MPLLEVQSLSKHYGGNSVLNQLDLEVREGEILGLIGPNGAGKTTLFNVISGVLPPDGGRVIFRGEDITGQKPHLIARKGLRRTFQIMTIWPELSVIDNLRTAMHDHYCVTYVDCLLNYLSLYRKKREIDERALETLRFVGMESLADRQAGACSHGNQRTLSLAIALATRPSLLLLDEPVVALNPERVSAIVALIKRIREHGTTVFIIEHNMRAIFNLCDRIVSISYGAKIAEGTPAEIREHPQVISAYLGVKKGAAGTQGYPLPLR